MHSAYGLDEAAARSRPNVLFYREKEFVDLSHFVPQRSTKGFEFIFNRPWNIKPMWATEHAMVDTFRYRFMSPEFKAVYGAEQLTGFRRTMYLAPDWMRVSGYGAAQAGNQVLRDEASSQPSH
jgi:hypothetical protein